MAQLRALVIDDEPLVVMDVIALLEEQGCDIVGPAATVAARAHSGAPCMVRRNSSGLWVAMSSIASFVVSEMSEAVSSMALPAFSAGPSFSQADRPVNISPASRAATIPL